MRLNSLHLFAAVGGGGEGDAPVWVQVIDVFEGEVAVERGVDGGGNGVVAEGAKRVHLDHFVFELDTLVAAREREELVEVEGGKTLALDASEVAATAFDPEDVFLLAARGGRTREVCCWCCRRRNW